MTFSLPIKLMPSVRVAPASADTGYIWGRPGHDSNIIETLGSRVRANGGVREIEMRPGDWTPIAPDDAVAERWVVSDDTRHGSCLCDGAGTLRDLLMREGRTVLGDRHVDEFGPFLTTVMKLIDTDPAPHRGGLSVQVHPAPGTPPHLANEPARPSKPEMWRGAGTVYLGWRHDIDRAGVLRALGIDSSEDWPGRRDSPDVGQVEGFEDLLQLVELSSDLPIVVPGGIAHAIRAGTFLAEWSLAPGRATLDRATLALYDGTDGKTPRPGKVDLFEALHVLEAGGGLSASRRFASVPLEIHKDDHGNGRTLAFRTEAIYMEDWTVATRLDPGAQAQARAWPLYAARGTVIIHTDAGDVALQAGEEALLPASAGRFTLEARGPEGALVNTWYRPTAADKARYGGTPAVRDLPA